MGAVAQAIKTTPIRIISQAGKPLVPFNISRLGKSLKIKDVYSVVDYCSNCDDSRWIEVEVPINKESKPEMGCCRVCGKITKC